MTIPRARESLASVRDLRSVLSVGLLDQMLQSAGTLLLTVAAGRALGPEGLGALALGYAALLIPAAIQRALLVDPYLTRAERSDDASTYAAAVTLTLLGGCGVGLLLLIVGVLADSALAHGLLAFSMWTPAYLLQALFRPAAFRHGRANQAAVASGVMLVTLAVALLIARPRTLLSVTAAWGVGMTMAALVALAKSRTPRITGLGRSFRWFTEEALPFGRWLTIASGVFTISSYATMAILASILGPAAVGAYRAVESVFAPLSLLGPGLSNPGYRELHVARAHGRELWVAGIISGLAVSMTAAYAGVLSSFRDLFVLVFGPDFTRYLFLVPPIAVGQLVLALPLGFALLLKVARRGRLYLPIGLLTPLASVLAVWIIAPRDGLFAAAWAIALCGFLSAGWAIAAAAHVSQHHREHVIGGKP